MGWGMFRWWVDGVVLPTSDFVVAAGALGEGL